jgi:hypothetical protein
MAGHSPVSLAVPTHAEAARLIGCAYSAASAVGGTTEIRVRPPVVLRNFT